MVTYPSTFSIQERLLILCEGHHDRAFLRALLKHHGITGFQTTDPSHLGEKRGGFTYWLQALNRIVSAPRSETLRGVVIMGDKDSNPTSRFRSITSALASAAAIPTTGTKFPIPTAPQFIASGSPSTMAILIPMGAVNGNLETFCLGPARQAASQAILHCVDQFAACSGWSQTKRSKAEFRALISCSYKKDPEISLAKIWEKCPNLVPIGDPAFLPLADLLKHFKANA